MNSHEVSGPGPERQLRRTFVLEGLTRQAMPERVADMVTARLLAVVAEQPPQAVVTLTLEAERDGEVTVSVEVNGAGPTFGEDLQWCSETAHSWKEDTTGAKPSFQVPAVMCEVVAEAAIRPRFMPSPLPGPEGSNGAPLLVLDNAVGNSDSVAGRALTTWPNQMVTSGIPLVRVLRSTGGSMRVHMGPASEVERLMLEDTLLRTEGRASLEATMRYLGVPVRMRVLVGVHDGNSLPARLAAILDGLASDLTLVPVDGPHNRRRLWLGEDGFLQGHAVPRGMAQGLVRVPVAGEVAEVIGLPCATSTIADVPLAEALPEDGIRLGTGLDSTGREVDVTISVTQTTQHVHVMGASGSGKTTLTAAVIGECVRKGMGVTVIDPHGPQVDRLLRELVLPEGRQLHVVRVGDLDHPVPINPFSGRDHDLVTAEVLEMLYAIYDPQRQGIIGPRFERLFRQVMDALHLLLGDRATISLVPEVLLDRERVRSVARAVNAKDPNLARALTSELVENKSAEFNDVLAWVTSKFDQLIRSRLMRNVMGSGMEMIDVAEVMRRGDVLLIDLAAPRIGAAQAQFIGMTWLLEHAMAMGERHDWELPHLVAVDEVQLFSAGGLPEMLAEGRKFGISLLLAHQHMGQLSPGLAAALEANASSVVALRSSLQDAPRVAERIGTWAGGSLSRLPNMRAATTLATPAGQTQAFTLRVDHNERVSAAERDNPGAADVRAQQAEASFRRRLGALGKVRPLTGEDLETVIRRSNITPSTSATGTSFLENWLEVRARAQQTNPAGHDLQERRALTQQTIDVIDAWRRERALTEQSAQAGKAPVGQEAGKYPAEEPK